MFLVNVSFNNLCLALDKDQICSWEGLVEEGLGTIDLPTNLWGFAMGLGLPSGMGEGFLKSWYWNCRYDCCCMAAFLESLSPTFIYSLGVWDIKSIPRRNLSVWGMVGQEVMMTRAISTTGYQSGWIWRGAGFSIGWFILCRFVILLLLLPCNCLLFLSSQHALT